MIIVIRAKEEKEGSEKKMGIVIDKLETALDVYKILIKGFSDKESTTACLWIENGEGKMYDGGKFVLVREGVTR